MEQTGYGEIKKMLEENQTLLRAIYENSEKTRKYIFWGKVMSFVYLLLILAPLVFAAIYLPPIVKKYFNVYQSVLGPVQEKQGLFQDLEKNLQKQLDLYQSR